MAMCRIAIAREIMRCKYAKSSSHVHNNLKKKRENECWG